MNEPLLSPLARALGRIPTGLYVVGSLDGAAPIGFVGSFLVQTGFAPPSLCVAIAKNRPHLAAVRGSERFAVSILDGASRGVMGAFFRKRTDGSSPFDELDHARSPSGCPILTGALAWLDCALTGEHETGDHVVVFGEVRDAELLREGDPSVHLRRNGLDY